MTISPIRPNEEFQCPLCQVNNRADAKFCRRCGISREILSGYASGAGRRDPNKPREITPESTVDLPVVNNFSTPQPSVQPRPGLQVPPPGVPIPSMQQNLAMQISPVRNPAAQNPALQNHAMQNPAHSATIKVGDAIAPSVPSPYVNPECAGCASVVRTSDRFCCWCGEAQPPRPKPVLKVCPDCSQSLPGRANFCFECGRAVGSKERLHMRLPTELFGEESSEFFPTFDA